MNDEFPGPTEAAIGDIDRAGGFPPSWGRPPAQRIPRSGRRRFCRDFLEQLRYKAGWDYAKRMIELGRKGDIHSIRAA
jgi:hypothetical protein